MNDIKQKQNTRVIIDRLAAQRHLYDIAKRYNTIHFVLAVVVIFIMSLIKASCALSEQYLALISLYSFTLGCCSFLFNKWQESKIDLAARIQQDLDCRLFRINWDKVHWGEKPAPEKIKRACKGQDNENLRNWYVGNFENLAPNNAALVCQRQNVMYDDSLRSKFLVGCYICLTVITLLIIIPSMYYGVSVWYLMSTLTMLFPIFNWFLAALLKNHKNISACRKNRTLIQNIIDTIPPSQEIDTQFLSEIQYLIFYHRKSSFAIYNKMYDCLRNNLEDEAV